jgi:hypothetical protein
MEGQPDLSPGGSPLPPQPSNLRYEATSGAIFSLGCAGDLLREKGRAAVGVSH